MHPPVAPTKESASGWRDRIAALRNIPPLLLMVRETGQWLALSSLALRLVSSLIPVAMLWIARLIIDNVVALVSHTGGDVPEVWALLAAEAGLAVSIDVIGRAIGLLDSLLGDRFTNVISLRMMEHAGKLDLISFEDPVFYDKMERARRQTTGRLGMLASLAGMCQQFITLLSLSASIVWFSPWFLPLLTLALVPVFLGETRFAMLSYSLLFRWTPERRQLDYLRMLGASNNSAKEVKIFGLGPYLTERARVLFERFYDENKRLAIRKAATGTLLNILPTAGYYSAYAIILHRTMTGALSVGDLTFLTAAFARSRGLMEQIFSTFSNVAEQAMFLEDLFDFFRTQPRIASKPDAIPAPRPIRSGYEFRNVSFSYPGSEKRVLDRVSFRIEAGERIALIGENGAGKTTIVKLLSRLYDPVAGEILLDGVDLRDYDVDDLRREIGVIFQDYMRYDMTAADNIGLGRVEALDDRGRIQQAAAQARAGSVIDALPAGFEQMLGRRFDGGVDLSAGQWQKIALARAYMRDAQVLVLDEPTASLDARAEFEVFRQFTTLTRGKMAVLISHRFSTVRMADRILVLEAGQIVEQGSHEDLVAGGGRYSELFELQAAGYR
ncbi:MAG: ABC transporter ATP-binding protein [Bryobacteraceae bacterium]|nr:ABC transporter ATP-binding protein [Bryobacteraceae bacterium]